MPGHTAVSTLHWPRNNILSFFKFLQKKVSWLDKKVSAHFCISLWMVICKGCVAKPLDSLNESYLPVKQI